jgi:hypothetical protein
MRRPRYAPIDFTVFCKLKDTLKADRFDVDTTGHNAKEQLLTIYTLERAAFNTGGNGGTCMYRPAEGACFEES